MNFTTKSIVILLLPIILITPGYCQENVLAKIGVLNEENINAKANVQNSTSLSDQWFKVKSASLYGGGALLGLVTSSDDVDENTSPSGSIGLNFNTSRLSADLFFSYNGKRTVEMTNLEQFGGSLMAPNSAGQSISFSLFGKLNEKFGFTGSILTVDNIWKLDASTEIDASPLVARLGFYIRPFDFSDILDSTNNRIDLTFNFNFTHREILGDFGNSEQEIGGQLIKRRGYNGFDFSTNIYLNSVQMFVQFSSNRKGEFEVPGFTGSQLTFGVNVTGALISLKKEKDAL